MCILNSLEGKVPMNAIKWCGNCKYFCALWVKSKVQGDWMRNMNMWPSLAHLWRIGPRGKNFFWQKAITQFKSLRSEQNFDWCRWGRSEVNLIITLGGAWAIPSLAFALIGQHFPTFHSNSTKMNFHQQKRLIFLRISPFHQLTHTIIMGESQKISLLGHSPIPIHSASSSLPKDKMPSGVCKANVQRRLCGQPVMTFLSFPWRAHDGAFCRWRFALRTCCCCPPRPCARYPCVTPPGWLQMLPLRVAVPVWLGASDAPGGSPAPTPCCCC